MRIIEKSAGYRRVEHNGNIYTLYRYESAYGDQQWMVDSSATGPCFAQVDSLPQAYATIKKAPESLS